MSAKRMKDQSTLNNLRSIYMQNNARPGLFLAGHRSIFSEKRMFKITAGKIAADFSRVATYALRNYKSIKRSRYADHRKSCMQSNRTSMSVKDPKKRLFNNRFSYIPVDLRAVN